MMTSSSNNNNSRLQSHIQPAQSMVRRQQVKAAAHHPRKLVFLILAGLALTTLIFNAVVGGNGLYTIPNGAIGNDNYNHNHVNNHIRSGQATEKLAAPPPLANDCLHVFLDAGANIGIHSRFLFEPEQYPKAKNAHQAFDMAFGSPRDDHDNHQKRDNRDICAFGFEPNPRHRPRQLELQEKYAAMGWRYFPIFAGVGDGEDVIKFYHNDAGNSNSEWGFSVVNRRKRPDTPFEEVPIIHFAKWIEENIMNRRMPTKIYGNYEIPDDTTTTTNNNTTYQGYPPDEKIHGKVVLKLDVEGVEFIVAPSLIYSGVMCHAIDVAFGEFHDASHIPVRGPMDATGQGALDRFTDWREAKKHFNTLWKAMKSVRPQDCKARWLDLFDEEDYLNDGVPFPEPLAKAQL